MNTRLKAIALSPVFALVMASAVSGCGDDAKVVPKVERVTIEAIEDGTCATFVDDNAFVREFDKNACGLPHAVEVAGRYTLTDAEYPGASALRLDTQLACRPIFEAFVGTSYFASEFDLRTVSPSPASWSVGDRTVLCLVVSKDGSLLTTLARDSGR